MILTEVPLTPFSAQQPVPIYILSTNCSYKDPHILPASIARGARRLFYLSDHREDMLTPCAEFS